MSTCDRRRRTPGCWNRMSWIGSTNFPAKLSGANGLLDSWGSPATPSAVISLEPWSAFRSVPRHVVSTAPRSVKFIASILLTSRILYAVHEFLTRFPVTCSAQSSRRGDQFLHPSGPRRQDRRDLLPAACCDLIAMRFGDFLDQSVGAQERQQTAHLTRLPPVHRCILRPLAVEAMPHVAIAEARDQMTPAPTNSNNRASTSPNGLSAR